MNENGVKGLLDTTMEKLRTMVDADTVIGEPLEVSGATIIPVSKVAFGLATGGSDFSGKGTSPKFGGGGGAGVSVTPIGFIVIKGNDVKMLQIYKDESSLNKAIGTLPELFEKISGLFKSKEEIDIDIK